MVRYPPILVLVTTRFTLLIPPFVRKLSLFGVERYRPLDSTNTNSVDRTITSGANDPLEGNLLCTN